MPGQLTESKMFKNYHKHKAYDEVIVERLAAYIVYTKKKIQLVKLSVGLCIVNISPSCTALILHLDGAQVTYQAWLNRPLVVLACN